MSLAVSGDADQLREEALVSAKVFRHLVWFLMLLFFWSFLDRTNTGFASLSMNQELGLTASMFGFANTAFYLPYVAAEIPSNIVLARLGARIWIPRIMVTWGLASMATSLATSALGLYWLRALVGLAEAGFMPGILLFITFWFPPSVRGRANSMFLMTQPIVLAVGSLLSAGLLEMHGILGLSGWRWLFIIEGLPSVALGIVAYFYLQNRPAEARWLTLPEKAALARALERRQGGDRTADRPPAAGAERPRAMLRQLADVRVLLLALAYVGLVISLSVNSAWVPQIVRGMVGNGSFLLIASIAAVPALFAIAAMPFVSASSDRRRERVWHLVVPILAASLGWALVALAAWPQVKFLGLVLVGVGTFAAQGIFWTLPPLVLAEATRPIGMAMINTLGLLGTLVGPFVIGLLKDLTQTFTLGLLFVAASLVMAAGSILAISRRDRNALRARSEGAPGPGPVEA